MNGTEETSRTRGCGARHEPRHRVAKTTEGIGGWLLVYVIGLVGLRLHEIQLAVGASLVYANPSIAGLHTSLPLGSLLFYEATNVFLVGLTIVAFSLMFRRRRAAIAANIALNGLAALFLVAWHFLGMKSPAGTVIDGLPSLVGVWYFVVSKRVRNTFARATDGQVEALAA